MLDFPSVTLRDSMERPEALEAGTVLMSGLDPDELVRNVRAAITAPCRSVPAGYDIPDTSRRTVNFILSTAARQREWFGVRPR